MEGRIRWIGGIAVVVFLQVGREGVDSSCELACPGHVSSLLQMGFVDHTLEEKRHYTSPSTWPS